MCTQRHYDILLNRDVIKCVLKLKIFVILKSLN